MIMGTNGRRGLKNLLVGSVAREVVHRSPVPVLTTRAATGRAFPPKKILVAFDSSEDSLRAVLLAAEWAQLLPAEVTLLHAVEPVTYPSFYAHYTVDGKYLDQISTQCREALAEVAKEHLRAVTHETAVIHARASEGITDFASSHGFDLVVLATRGLSGIAHTLFGSVAERVTQTSEVPVLTVREPPQAPASKTKESKEIHKDSKTIASESGSRGILLGRTDPDADGAPISPAGLSCRGGPRAAPWSVGFLRKGAPGAEPGSRRPRPTRPPQPAEPRTTSRWSGCHRQPDRHGNQRSDHP